MEGEGILFSRDGEMYTWNGSGLGKFKGGGAISYRGILYYRMGLKNWCDRTRFQASLNRKLIWNGKHTQEFGNGSDCPISTFRHKQGIE